MIGRGWEYETPYRLRGFNQSITGTKRFVKGCCSLQSLYVIMRTLHEPLVLEREAEWK